MSNRSIASVNILLQEFETIFAGGGEEGGRLRRKLVGNIKLWGCRESKG